MKDFNEFLAWEKSAQDTIDFKRIYADMAGDTLAGLVLSQIVFWHIPNKKGESKLRIERDGKKWMACSRAEWWETTRLSPRQIDRVLDILEKLHLIEREVFKFAGSPTVHIRINEKTFVMLHDSHLANPIPNPYASEKKRGAKSDLTDSLNGNQQNVNIDIDESVFSFTENTTETLTEKKEKDSADYVAQETKNRIIKDRVSNPYYDAIRDLFDIHGGQNGDFQKMLEGVSKKKEYAEYNMNPPVAVDEFIEWGKTTKKELGKYMIKSPAKVNGSIIRFREKKSLAASKPKETVSYAPKLSAEAQALYDAEQIRVAAVRQAQIDAFKLSQKGS